MGGDFINAIEPEFVLLFQIGYPEFELVVYTTENAMTFYPIVDGLDPEVSDFGTKLYCLVG